MTSDARRYAFGDGLATGKKGIGVGSFRADFSTPEFFKKAVLRLRADLLA